MSDEKNELNKFIVSKLFNKKKVSLFGSKSSCDKSVVNLEINNYKDLKESDMSDIYHELNKIKKIKNIKICMGSNCTI